MPGPEAETPVKLPPDPSDPPGKPDAGALPRHRIGRYELLQKLGAGELGQVYRARHWAFEQDVLIKVCPRGRLRHAEQQERFHRAARQAARVQHANLLNAIDIGQSESGQAYFVMEYLEGQSLADLLRCVEFFEERRALEIVLQVARALEHLHARGLTHGRVFPDHIYLARNQAVKLSGIGLAQELVDRALHGTRAGVPPEPYLSPEVAHGQAPDIRSDLFSLGATLYHLVTGRPPFEATASAHRPRRWSASPGRPSPQHLNPALSDALCHLLERLLARHPEDRYATPRELLEDLERIKEGSPLQSARLEPGKSWLLRPEAPAPVVPEPRGRARRTGSGGRVHRAGAPEARQRALVWGLLAGFLLVLATLIAYYLFLPRPPRHPGPAPAASSAPPTPAPAVPSP